MIDKLALTLIKNMGMNIFSFTAEFDSVEACRIHFEEERDKIGVVCKRCSHTAHYWLKSQWSYE